MSDERAGGGERLDSPEQLDQLVQVSTSASWLLLVAFTGLVLAALGWGVFGRVDTRVQGEGVLLGGPIHLVVARGSGPVTRLAVEVGDRVEVGEVVAELELPDLERQIADARTKLAEAESDHAELVTFSSREGQLKREYLAKQREGLETSIREAQARMQVLQEQMANERSLAEKGVLTQRDLLPTQDTFNATSASLERSRADLTQLRSQELRDSYQAEKDLLTSERAIEVAQRELEKLEADRDRQGRVVAAQSGLVLEVLTEVGSLVSDGTAVVKLGLAGAATEELHALAYVGADDGKKIRPGMEVGLAPTTARPERDGYLRGRVRRVSAFPATSEAMKLAIKNDPLVSRLSQSGTPFEIEVELVEDASAPSGYAWTSGHGPDLVLGGGTLAKAYVVVDRQRPIELVIPSAKGLVGSG